MKAISIRQPWAYLIASGIKDIENRTWKCPEKYIGTRVLIHASAKTLDWDKLINYMTYIGALDHFTYKWTRKWLEGLQTGAIIGSVEIVECVLNHSSIWAEKTALPEQLDNKCIWNWVLANPILFDEPILNVKGKLGFWDYEFSEDDYECTNDNGYTLGSCGERAGCPQDCSKCDYYKCKYDIE